MSVLIFNIKSHIKQHDIKVVSFDLFDTLIYRKVSKPSDIFALSYAKVNDSIGLALSKNEFEELRISAEKEAKYNAPGKEVSLEEIYDYMPFSQSIKAALLKSELETETLYGFLFEPLLNLITELKAQGIQVLFLSDMYLSKEQIHTTFFDQNKWICDIPLYVSSEYKKNKASGQLFHYVKEQLSLEYSEWLHVGDNLKSDFEVPHKIGGRAIHVAGALNSKQIFDTEQLCSPGSLDFNAARHLSITNHCGNKYVLAEPVAFDIGAFVWGPALLAFSDWVIDKTISANSHTILCLMREAEVYVPLIEQRLSQRNISHITVKKLFASRKSTFWPSIDVTSKNWLVDLINLLIIPRGYTVADFYCDFHLKPDDIYSKFHNSLVKRSDGLFYNGRSVLKCLTELAASNIKKIKNYISAQKSNFINYYETNIVTPYEKCTVVDLGNGGTIQYQIQQIFGRPCSANLLFYASKRIYRYTSTTTYSSFINTFTETNQAAKLLARTPECVEAFLVGDCGTTLAYSDDGKLMLAPKLDGNSTIVKAFMQGAHEYFNQHHELGFGDINLADVNCILLRYVQFPTIEEAKLFTRVYHQDNFGSDFTYTVICENQLEQVQDFGFENTFLEFTRYTRWKIGKIHWPQAILNLLSDKFMQKQYGLMAKNTDNDVAELYELINQNQWQSFSIYGAGEFFEKLHHYIDKHSLNVEMVIDRKAEVSGSYEFLGYPVISLEQAIKSNCQNIVICSMRFKDEIAKNIFKLSQKYNSDSINILSL
ncbi:hypothetical protein [Alteromonas sp. M12]|uniref:HAD family hydrolase n=1 Tax=Alteromonas sp. M12 TaxID=3135644 RepID=UPI00319EB4D2